MADIAIVTAAIRTTNGTQDFTVPGTVTPKGAVVYVGFGSADGVLASHAVMGAGATDGTNHLNVSSREKDAVSTTVGGSQASTNRMVTVIDQDGNDLVLGSFSAWINDGVNVGVRINWTLAPPTGYLVKVVLFGGPGTNACYAGKVITPATIDTKTDVTTVPFLFDYGLTFGNGGGTFSDSQGAHASLTFGCVTRAGANPHPQGCVSMFGISGLVGPTVSSIILLNNTTKALQDANVTPGTAVEITDIVATGFSAYTRLNSNPMSMGYFLVKTNNVSAKIALLDTPTVGGSNVWSGIGFTPQFAMLFQTDVAAHDTRYVDKDVLGIGLVTAAAQACVMIDQDDAVTPSVCKSMTTAKPVNLYREGAAFMDATFTSFGNGSMTLNFGTVNATVRKWLGLFVQTFDPTIGASPSVVCATSANLSTAISFASSSSGICDAGIMALATDTFDGPGSADLGTSWDPTLRTFKVTADGLGLAQAVSNGGSDAAERNNAAVFPRNQYGRVKFGDIGTTSIGQGYGLALRMDVGGLNTLYRIVGATSGWEVAKEVAAVFGFLANNASPAFANGDTLEVAIVDDGPYVRFFMKRNTVVFGSGTVDLAASISSGAVGVYHSTTTQAGATVGIDTWEAGRYGPYLTSAITLAGAPTGVCSTSVSLSTLSRFASASSCVCSTRMQGGDLFAAAIGKCATSATMVIGGLWSDAGLNFRQTLGYVSETTQQLPILGEFFPHTYFINGQPLIAGWTGTGPTLVANENAALDRRLAGVNGKLNDGNQVTFKVRLPQAGNWRLFFALGEATALDGYQYIQLQDETVPFATYDNPAGTAAGQWYAPDNGLYDATTWPSTGSLLFIEHGFTDAGDGSALLTIVVGTPAPAADSSTLAHLRLLVSPNQGAILKGSPGCACSTITTITVPMSATATGVCSTAGSIYNRMDAQASGTCSTSVSFSTLSLFAAHPTCVCATVVPLTTTPLALAARAGGSCVIKSQDITAYVDWVPITSITDLAGYKVKYGTTPGGPYPTIIDVGLPAINLLLWSDDLTNAVWTKEGARVEPGAHAQDGTVNGFELIQTVLTGYHRISQLVTVPATTVCSSSVKLNKNAVSLAMVRLFGDAFHSYAAEFDLVNGVVTPGSSAPYPGTSASITDLGGGDYLCVVSGTVLAGPATIYIEMNNAVHNGQYAGDASSSLFLSEPMLLNAPSPALYVATQATQAITYRVTGLSPGSTYYFVVTAYDTAGPPNESPASGQVSEFEPWGLKTSLNLAAAATCACSTSANLRTSGAIDLVGAAGCKAATNAPNITTSITLAAAASGSCSASTTLTVNTSAVFAAASTGKAAATAAITTAMALAAATICAAITNTALQFPGSTLASQSSGGCSTSATLATVVALAAISSGTLATAAGLSTSLTLTGISSAACATNAPALTTAITLAAASTGKCASVVSFGGETFLVSATGKCATSAALTTAITLAASATGACGTAAVISGDTKLLTHATLSCATAATLASVIRFSSTSAAGCATIGSLTTGITQMAAATGKCATTGSLTTGIALAAAATGKCATTVSLSTIVINMLGAPTGKCATAAILGTAIRLASSSTGKCTVTPVALVNAPFSGIRENVDERGDERGIERGIFSGGG